MVSPQTILELPNNSFQSSNARCSLSSVAWLYHSYIAYTLSSLETMLPLKISWASEEKCSHGHEKHDSLPMSLGEDGGGAVEFPTFLQSHKGAIIKITLKMYDKMCGDSCVKPRPHWT